MKGEALQYLGKKEEAESVLEIANALEPEGRRQIEENTSTTTYSTKKDDFNLFFFTVSEGRYQGQTQPGQKTTEPGPVSDKHEKNGKEELKNKSDDPRERRRKKARAAKVKTPPRY